MKTIFLVITANTRVNFILRTDIFKILKEKGYRLIVISPFYKEDWFIKEFGGQSVVFEKFIPKAKIGAIWDSWRSQILAINHPKMKIFKETHDYASRRFVKKKNPVQKIASIFKGFVLALIPGFLKTSADLWDKIGFYFLVTSNHKKLFRKYSPAAVVLASAGAEGSETPYISYCGKYGIFSFAVDNNIDVFEYRYLSKPMRVSKWTLFGDPQKEEAIEIQKIPSSELVVPGPARYDYYFKGFKPMPREEFFKKIGADPKKKLITYGAKIPVMYPHNGDIMRIILDAIKERKFNDAQLFVRFDPNHDAKIYGDLLKEIIYERAEEAPTRDHLANLFYYSDVVVSIGSTFGIEACFTGTPAIWVGFDGYKKYDDPKDAYGFIYELDLFKRIADTKGIPIVWTKEELTDKIKKYLADRNLDADKRKKLIDQEYSNPDGHAGERIANIIIETIK
ncbi:MAG: hypothetical protein PHN74_01805 [Candidatus Pacebacteria bacterium]|nr:hypothetical protein [Candidatus Paceibacterota bacterium]